MTLYQDQEFLLDGAESEAPLEPGPLAHYTAAGDAILGESEPGIDFANAPANDQGSNFVHCDALRRWSFSRHAHACSWSRFVSCRCRVNVSRVPYQDLRACPTLEVVDAAECRCYGLMGTL